MERSSARKYAARLAAEPIRGISAIRVIRVRVVGFVEGWRLRLLGVVRPRLARAAPITIRDTQEHFVTWPPKPE